MVRCGLCCTARHVVKISHEEAIRHGKTFQDLLVSIYTVIKAMSYVQNTSVMQPQFGRQKINPNSGVGGLIIELK